MDSLYILSDVGNVSDKRIKENIDCLFQFITFYFFFSRLHVHLARARKKREEFFKSISIYLKSSQSIFHLTQANEDSSRVCLFSPGCVYLGDSEGRYLAKTRIVVPGFHWPRMFEAFY